MLDLRFVRENPDIVRAALSRRGLSIDLTEFHALDARRRAAQQEGLSAAAHRRPVQRDGLAAAARDTMAVASTNYRDMYKASLGASFSAAGQLLLDYRQWIRRVGGILIIVFGLYIAGVLRIALFPTGPFDAHAAKVRQRFEMARAATGRGVSRPHGRKAARIVVG